MWTERERYITSFDEIKAYIEEMDCFHDHRIGNVEYDGKVAKITVEEIVPDKHISESAGNIWDFTITGIESYQMNCDCAFTWFLNELTLEDGELVFNCTNGYVSIKAKEIKLGIPSQQVDKLEFVGMCVMDVITHYDLLVDENNDPFRDSPPLQEYMNGWDGEQFLESLELSNNKNVLEIGIGTGRIAVKVAPYCMKLTGIDISPKTIERARENLKDYSNICFVCGDFNEYGFVETFDVIYSSLTMMHFKDKKQVILKVAALLNEGGIFCLSIDKNQSEYIDMGTRKVKIYPDTPDNIISLIYASSMNVANVFETDNAYIIVSNK